MPAETEPAFDTKNTGLAVFLVIVAGGATALGAAPVFEERIVRLSSKRTLAAGLSFSAGIMLYISLVHIFAESQKAFIEEGLDVGKAHAYTVLVFFAGLALLRLVHGLAALVERRGHEPPAPAESEGLPPVSEESGENDSGEPEQIEGGHIERSCSPEVESGDGRQSKNPGEFSTSRTSNSSRTGSGRAKMPSEISNSSAEVPWRRGKSPGDISATRSGESAQVPAASGEAARRDLRHLGVSSAVALAIHNLPEGFATFVATLASPKLGAIVAFGVIMHNVPEGMCIALPIFYATGSRIRAFFWALLSGLSEPMGAFIAWITFSTTGDDVSGLVYAVVFGVVGGVMTMMSVSSLLPAAWRYDPEDKVTTYGTVAGMGIMALSMCLDVVEV